MNLTATPHSPTLRRITNDLDATDVEIALTTTGDTIAQFRSMGHTFHFHIRADGTIVSRSCHNDTDGILSRREMEALRDVCGRELARARRGCFHAELLEVLARAEIKLSLVLQAGELLTLEERGVLASVLAGYRDGLHARSEDPGLRGFLTRTLDAIHTKLGV